MLHWAVVLLCIALVAAAFGFGGIASTATGMAQILFVVALILFLVSAIGGFIRRRGPPRIVRTFVARNDRAVSLERHFPPRDPSN